MGSWSESCPPRLSVRSLLPDGPRRMLCRGKVVGNIQPVIQEGIESVGSSAF